ncbi:hypothetical protein MRY87_08845, partial [bacterium]|nr:hypothetical protein [bacterium]
VIAHWIHERYKTRNFVSKGLSGLGAVVGATDPEEARAMRELLPNSLFLVPGYGSQGASAADALAGIRPGKSKELAGVLVNSSRAIFEITDSAMLAKDGLTRDDFCELIRSRVKAANAELLEAFEGVRS